jgi:hypothetical protein
MSALWIVLGCLVAVYAAAAIAYYWGFYRRMTL